jgi:hypothetical protein
MQMISDEISANRDLLRVRRSVVNFRAKWKFAFEKAEAKRFTFGSERELRSVFGLPDDHQLLEQFERACVGLQTGIGQALRSVGRQRAPEMWVPTLVRRCNRIGVVESEPIQQEMSPLPKARAFARKCGVEEISRDWVYVIRRYARTLELLIVTDDSGENRWYAVPLTEWAVVGASVPISTSSSRLRSKKWNERPSAASQNDAWAQRRQMRLICQSGQASLYGGPLVQLIANDEEDDLLPG